MAITTPTTMLPSSSVDSLGGVMEAVGVEGTKVMIKEMVGV